VKNQAFSFSSLDRLIRPSDFTDEQLVDETYRERIINLAVSCSNNLFSESAPLDELKLGTKTGYKAKKLPEKLVLRKMLQNLRRNVPDSFKHRDQIASELITYLKEGSIFCIYRLDIKSFFESVPLEFLYEKLELMPDLSNHTKKLIISFLDRFYYDHMADGLPRGVEISSVLSEIVLSDFDKFIARDPNVFYWTRYVDDIILITSSNENKKYFLSRLQDRLPPELKFNRSKQSIIDIPKKSKNGGLVGCLDFLGYKYSIIDAGSVNAYRTINIDLSESKVVKFKTRISQALYNYKKTNDFDLLYDRLIFLASNRDITSSKNRNIATGIYYSYPKIDPKASLAKNLDPFLRKNVLSSRFNFSQGQIDILLKISFPRAFKERTFKKFSPYRLFEISRVWK
jgi:hypothetical protein